MNYSPVIMQTEDMEVIHGWYMAENDPRLDPTNNVISSTRRLIIFFHENAGNLGLRLDYF